MALTAATPPSALPPDMSSSSKSHPPAGASADERSPRRLRPAQLAIASFVVAIAGMLATGALMLPADKGYSIVGTFAFPLAVALFLGVTGCGLALQALRGGFAALPPDEHEAVDRPAAAERLGAAAWVSSGLLLDALLIEHIGFVAAATLLFAAAARGFGSRRWLHNVAWGLAIAWPVYLAFTLGLGLSLPGLAKPWI